MKINTTIVRSGLLLGFATTLGACSDSHDGALDGGAPSGSAAGTTASSGAGSSGDNAGTNGGSGSSGNGSSGASGNGSTADPNEPAAPGVPPTFIPSFPGAGTSGDDAPLTNGELCDYVPLNGAPTPNEITTCFFAPGDPVPAATMEQVLECVDGQDVVHVRLTFSPTFVDNTYGENAIGWAVEEDPMMAAPMMGMGKPRKGGKGFHNYDQLVGSDHAEIALKDENGDTVVQFKLDYISEDPDAPSGYASLGVSGGDGEMIVGEAEWILDFQTSIETNLNDRGYSSYLVDSPATDEDYTPNPDAPEWDFRYVFEAWIDVAAFGDVGFGTALIESVHASPSKADSNTLEVEPGDCPPPPCDESQPDVECTPSDPPPDEPPPDECDPTQVDVECGDSGVPPPPEVDCIDTPEDPACNVD